MILALIEADVGMDAELWRENGWTGSGAGGEVLVSGYPSKFKLLKYQY